MTYFGLTLERAALARRLAARGAVDGDGGPARRGAAAARAQATDLPCRRCRGSAIAQFVEVALGRLDAAAALALMQRDTVRYAKRQMTWFVREPGVAWIDVAAAGGAAGVAATIAEKLDKAEGRIG